MSFFTQSITLALPSTDVPLVYQHPLSHLITSLPYADEETDSQVMSQVQRLIQDEMKIMPKKDYLASLQLKSLKNEESTILSNEFERVKKGIALNSIDTERYKPENFLVSEQINDLNAVKAAISKAECLDQQNNFKLINLELLNKYGPASWKDYLTESDRFEKSKEKEATAIKYAIDEINAKRKFEQIQAKDKINEINEKLYFMQYKNQALEIECERIEREVRDIRLKKLKKV